MKNLVLSIDTYSWIKYTTGRILQDPCNFIITVIQRDVYPILDYNKLCEDAILAQRRYDLFKIGKVLGIKKLQNLMYDEYINISKLSAQLQIQIVVGGIGRIYFQKSDLLRSLFHNLTVPDIKIYEYGVENYTESFVMSDIDYHKKLSLIDYMIGISRPEEWEGFSQTEYFRKI